MIFYTLANSKDYVKCLVGSATTDDVDNEQNCNTCVSSDKKQYYTCLKLIGNMKISVMLFSR